MRCRGVGQVGRRRPGSGQGRSAGAREAAPSGPARHARAAGAIALALLAPLALSACTGSVFDSLVADGSTETASSSSTTSATGAGVLLDASSLFSDRDLDPSYDEVDATIELSDDGTVVDGDGVTVSGSEVTITAGGTYVLCGSLSDGRIVIDVSDDEKVQLVLAGVSVASSGPCALYVRSADKVFLTLAEGSENVLSATGASEEEDDRNVDGAIFSTEDLTINGSGSLEVSSAEGHGIVGKDDLTLVSGTVSVTAAKHALQANDSVAIAGGTWTLVGGTDGIHCENEDDITLGYICVAGGELDITAGSDGFDASGVIEIDDGTITVSAGDDGIHAEYDLAVCGGTISVTESYEGLEGSTVTICGGTVDIVSSDDGINAAGEPSDDSDAAEGGNGGAHWSMDSDDDPMASDDTAWILISDGVITIDASGDGIDSNGDLTITGGEIYVTGPSQSADGALDYAGDGQIDGGILVAAGASGMAQNLGTSSSQVAMLVSVSGSAGEEITLCDASGTVLASYTPVRDYECVVVSAPGLSVGETYTLTCGDESTEVTPDSVSYSETGLGGVMGSPVGGGGGAGGSGMGGGPGGSGDGGDLGVPSESSGGPR